MSVPLVEDSLCAQALAGFTEADVGEVVMTHSATERQYTDILKDIGIQDRHFNIHAKNGNLADNTAPLALKQAIEVREYMLLSLPSLFWCFWAALKIEATPSLGHKRLRSCKGLRIALGIYAFQMDQASSRLIFEFVPDSGVSLDHPFGTQIGFVDESIRDWMRRSLNMFRKGVYSL